MQIGQAVAEIWPFFIFQHGGRPNHVHASWNNDTRHCHCIHHAAAMKSGFIWQAIFTFNTQLQISVFKFRYLYFSYRYLYLNTDICN